MFEIVYVNGENAPYKFGGGGDEEKNRLGSISAVYPATWEREEGFS